jgi:hypothetical protein
MLCFFRTACCSCVSCTAFLTARFTGAGDGDGLAAVLTIWAGFTGFGEGEGLVGWGCFVAAAAGVGEGFGEVLAAAGGLDATGFDGVTGVLLVGSITMGAGTGFDSRGGWIGFSTFGLTSWLQSRPMTLPGGPYWQTYVGHEQPVLTAQPSLVVDLHTRAVK